MSVILGECSERRIYLFFLSSLTKCYNNFRHIFSMKKIIIANWKCNPATERDVKNILKVSDDAQIIVCPPFVFLPLAKSLLKKAKLGAQDGFYSGGAYTGEVSMEQLKSLKVQSVIIGHSERREIFNESDEMVSGKLEAAIKAQMNAILCVGERDEERKMGKRASTQFVRRQLTSVLQNISPKASKKIIIAYEPVWSIGSGVTPSIEEIDEMIDSIREIASQLGIIGIKIIYGGSVTLQNVAYLIGSKNTEGFLIGGSSVRIDDFKKIKKIINP